MIADHVRQLRRDSGTIFLETLVSVLILSAMLSAFFTALTSFHHQTNAAEQRRLGQMIAQSRAISTGVETPLSLGTTTGLTSGYVWQTSVQPYQASRAESAAGYLVLVRTSVRPENKPGPVVTLSSLRLMPKGEL